MIFLSHFLNQKNGTHCANNRLKACSDPSETCLRSHLWKLSTGQVNLQKLNLFWLLLKMLLLLLWLIIKSNSWSQSMPSMRLKSKQGMLNRFEMFKQMYLLDKIMSKIINKKDQTSIAKPSSHKFLSKLSNQKALKLILCLATSKNAENNLKKGLYRDKNSLKKLYLANVLIFQLPQTTTILNNLIMSNHVNTPDHWALPKPTHILKSASIIMLTSISEMILERFSIGTKNKRKIVWIWKIDSAKDMKHLKLKREDNGQMEKMNGVMKEVLKWWKKPILLPKMAFGNQIWTYQQILGNKLFLEIPKIWLLIHLSSAKLLKTDSSNVLAVQAK